KIDARDWRLVALRELRAGLGRGVREEPVVQADRLVGEPERGVRGSIQVERGRSPGEASIGRQARSDGVHGRGVDLKARVTGQVAGRYRRAARVEVRGRCVEPKRWNQAGHTV